MKQILLFLLICSVHLCSGQEVMRFKVQDYFFRDSADGIWSEWSNGAFFIKSLFAFHNKKIRYYLASIDNYDEYNFISDLDGEYSEDGNQIFSVCAIDKDLNKYHIKVVFYIDEYVRLYFKHGNKEELYMLEEIPLVESLEASFNHLGMDSAALNMESPLDEGYAVVDTAISEPNTKNDDDYSEDNAYNYVDIVAKNTDSGGKPHAGNDDSQEGNSIKEDIWAIKVLHTIAKNDYTQFEWITKDEVAQLPENCQARDEFERKRDKIFNSLPEGIEYVHNSGLEAGVDWTSYKYLGIKFKIFPDRALGGKNTAEGRIYFQSNKLNFEMHFDKVIITEKGEWKFFDPSAIQKAQPH
jgi:hypothetical protein